MKHISQRYFDKHGHYPKVVVVSGIQRLTVEFAPGYVRIAASHPYHSQVYITRSAFLALLRKLLPLAKKWAKESHPDHDVPAAMQEAYYLEISLLEEKRRLKKARPNVMPPDSRKQRKRFLAARERARRAAEED